LYDNGVTGHAFDAPQITAMGLLAETYAGLNARIADQLAPHGLSVVEFEVLLRLARSPDHALRMTDLASQTMITTSGITRVVDRLERDRLVERTACPTDRRGSFARLTQTGLDRLESVVPGHVELIEQWFTGQLSSAQLDAMLAALRAVRDVIRPDATAGAPTPPDSGFGARDAVLNPGRPG
jgi:MarR family transcriptional regulator, 2-MHQ and catechol-resistance regulon repressor